ncbi:MAG: glutamate 5-kinase [Nitrospirota bacterium]|nr:glutamate 5-kinase [Nitrospirota bacterium]
MTIPRQTLPSNARRVVIKVGSGVISSRKTGLLAERFALITEQVAELVADGREVVIVSSGAVAAGVAVLGLREITGIPVRQACAAAGQSRLIWKYEKHFQARNLRVAQVLLTQDDVANRRRFLNARNTMGTLLSLGIVPIVNENDSVVVEEIKFGDNDTLSALVATVVAADLLVILSDVEGLFTADPRKHPEATRLDVVPEITAEIRAMAGGAGSHEGTGGMVTKLAAAERLAEIGIPTLLLNGTRPGTIRAAFAGEDVGTLFLARSNRKARKKQWLSHVARVEGTIHVDAGAAEALRGGKKSLLASGITRVDGRFEMGAGVVLAGPDGKEIARGLSNYSAPDIERIRGQHSSKIESILGHRAYDEVVHRDNLSVTE